MKHYLLAEWRHISDLILRWFWFSYRISAVTGQPQFHDTETHDFRTCPNCHTFLRTLSLTHQHTCPVCGITPYQLTTQGVVYEKKVGMFATHTQRFVLTHTLHDPYKSWFVVLVTCISIVLSTYASSLFRTPLDDCVGRLMLLNESEQAHLFVALVALATCCRMTCDLLHKKMHEPPRLFAAFLALVVLTLGIILYGAFHTLTRGGIP